MLLKKEVQLLKKDITEIKDKFGKLTEETINKAKKYDELNQYLKNVRLNVTGLAETYDIEKMRNKIVVSYSIDPINIYIDMDNNVSVNETFKSINMLNLISFDDMAKITNKIEQIKKNNIRK